MQDFTSFIDFSAIPDERRSECLVVVGMSGGVDSSVAALLAKSAGFRVLGLFMRNWVETDESGACSAEADYEDVIRVCEQLDIEYHAVDFSREYKERVFDKFLADYERGLTPNPDILCNSEIKFQVFFDFARSLGADIVATGHYCRVLKHQGKKVLGKGIDPKKDQSYFLHLINPEALNHTWFPLGHLPKTTVREIAEMVGLSNRAKKDSTGICFIEEKKFREFLGRYVKENKGMFVNQLGEEVGSHQGTPFYTIGQRKGLGLGGPGEPWYVYGKDLATKSVKVVRGDQHPALYSDQLIAINLNWFCAVKDEESLMCKVRYRQQDRPCLLQKLEDGRVLVTFETPERAITPGQSVVFYRGDTCVGGGEIEIVAPNYFDRGLASLPPLSSPLWSLQSAPGSFLLES